MGPPAAKAKMPSDAFTFIKHEQPHSHYPPAPSQVGHAFSGSPMVQTTSVIQHSFSTSMGGGRSLSLSLPLSLSLSLSLSFSLPPSLSLLSHSLLKFLFLWRCQCHGNYDGSWIYARRQPQLFWPRKEEKGELCMYNNNYYTTVIVQ